MGVNNCSVAATPTAVVAVFKKSRRSIISPGIPLGLIFRSPWPQCQEPTTLRNGNLQNIQGLTRNECQRLNIGLLSAVLTYGQAVENLSAIPGEDRRKTSSYLRVA